MKIIFNKVFTLLNFINKTENSLAKKNSILYFILVILKALFNTILNYIFKKPRFSKIFKKKILNFFKKDFFIVFIYYLY